MSSGGGKYLLLFIILNIPTKNDDRDKNMMKITKSVMTQQYLP